MARTATRCSTTRTGRSSLSTCSATASSMCWPPAPARSGSDTSTRAFTATTAGARSTAEEPVGAYGIVRFSPGLEPAWHYPRYTEVGPWDAVSDCYALNVDDTCAWACYYADFPVVCIRDGTVTGWHNDIKGARALAVAGSRVALFGGYGPDYDRLALTELGADRAQPAGEYRIVLSDGAAAPARHSGHRPGKPPALPHRYQLVPARHGRYPGMIRHQSQPPEAVHAVESEPGFWRRRVTG